MMPDWTKHRAITAEQMRAIEARAVHDQSISSFALMYRAGCQATDAILSWKAKQNRTKPLCPIILVGPGNNGGDGLIIACQLAAKGYNPIVFSDLNITRTGDAALAEALWRDVSPEPAFRDLAELDSMITQANGEVLIVDALFGIGLTRPIVGVWRDGLVTISNLPEEQLVAIDLPSGFHSDTGQWLGNSPSDQHPAHYGLTVTFHAPKTGHVLAQLACASTELHVVDIGLNDDITGTAFAQPSTKLLKKVSQHKYDHGHAVIVAGPPGKGGAARLAARAALRAGAGLVTLACTEKAMVENAAQLNAVMLHATEGDDNLVNWIKGDPRIISVGLGPGLGLTENTHQTVLSVLSLERATVLDADALTVFTDNPKPLLDSAHERTVLTPHGGEFARLFPDLADEARYENRAIACQKAAKRAGAFLVLKGPDTTIAGPNGEVWLAPALYSQAAPWLATAGSGDVLTGLITGLLARGLNMPEAITSAVWLHQKAGRAAGPGMIAEDLPEQIPRILSTLA